MLRALPADAVRKISAGQVIVDVPSALKELIENSIDANASRITVSLEDEGLGRITVMDNGCGMPRSTREFCCRRSHTSKLTDLDGLGALCTLGFRGEALTCLCSVSESVTVYTRQKDEHDVQAMEFNELGELAQSSTMPLREAEEHSLAHAVAVSTGTIVQITHLFHHVPVRLQMQRARQGTYAKCKELVCTYAISHPEIAIQLLAPPKPSLIKEACDSRLRAIVAVFGRPLGQCLSLVKCECTLNSDIETEDGRRRIQTLDDTPKRAKIQALLPRRHAPIELVCRSTPDRCFFILNHRPIEFPAARKLLVGTFREVRNISARKFPFLCVSIDVPSNTYDVNLTADKRKVLFYFERSLIAAIETLCASVWDVDTLHFFCKAQEKKRQESKRISEERGALSAQPTEEDTPQEQEQSRASSTQTFLNALRIRSAHSGEGRGRGTAVRAEYDCSRSVPDGNRQSAAEGWVLPNSGEADTTSEEEEEADDLDMDIAWGRSCQGVAKSGGDAPRSSCKLSSENSSKEMDVADCSQARDSEDNSLGCTQLYRAEAAEEDADKQSAAVNLCRLQVEDVDLTQQYGAEEISPDKACGETASRTVAVKACDKNTAHLAAVSQPLFRNNMGDDSMNLEEEIDEELAGEGKRRSQIPSAVQRIRREDVWESERLCCKFSQIDRCAQEALYPAGPEAGDSCCADLHHDSCVAVVGVLNDERGLYLMRWRRGLLVFDVVRGHELMLYNSLDRATALNKTRVDEAIPLREIASDLERPENGIIQRLLRKLDDEGYTASFASGMLNVSSCLGAWNKEAFCKCVTETVLRASDASEEDRGAAENQFIAEVSSRAKMMAHDMSLDSASTLVSAIIEHTEMQSEEIEEWESIRCPHGQKVFQCLMESIPILEPDEEEDDEGSDD